MPSMLPALLSGSLWLISPAVCLAAADITYTVVDLGGLGGDVWAQGINNYGQIVGEAYLSNNVTRHAFIYTGGVLSDLEPPVGSSNLSSSANDINDTGQIVGWADRFDGGTAAFLHFRSVVHYLTLGGSYRSEALAINSSGQVAGYSSVSNSFAERGFLYSDGAIQDLGTLGGNSSIAFDINDAGQVVGDSSVAPPRGGYHAFRYTGAIEEIGAMTDLSSSAHCINNRGQIAGAMQVDDGFGSYNAFLYDAGIVRNLGTLGGLDSDALDINSNGQVVGEAEMNSGDLHAFLYSEGQMQDLNPLVPPDFGWVLFTATGINDKGQIIVQGSSNNIVHSFLLNPSNLTVLSFHRLEPGAIVFTVTDGVDAPIPVKPHESVLLNQPFLGRGLIADGVTPVLFRFDIPRPPIQPDLYEITFEYEGGSVTDLASHLWMLTGSEFVRTNRVVVPINSKEAFAYIAGVKAQDVVLNPGSQDVSVQVNVKANQANTSSQRFRITKPPVVLVHGYSADQSTWSPEFLNVLAESRPAEFVVPIEYGVKTIDGKKNNDQNKFGNLQDLVYVLDAKLKEFEDNKTDLRKNWAFTRYDVLAHSQGGLLIRMLCAENPVPHPLQSFRRQENLYRGRFHRVITIDSPHNGSVIPYYLGELGPTPRALIPAILRLRGVLQDKFNPFGAQITNLNALAIDPAAKFHLIRTTIADGKTPSEPPLGQTCPFVYLASGLCSPFRGPVLLPRGSDGVVDFDSMGAGPGTMNTVISGENISHSEPEWAFGVASNKTATRDITVAGRVRQLFDGPSDDFGPFVNPSNLDSLRRQEIDNLAALVTFADLVSLLTPGPFSSTEYDYAIQPVAGEPLAGEVAWSVEVFGTNGVSTEGVSIVVDTNDSRNVAVTVDSTMKGAAILYANYTSTKGTLVMAKPVIITENPAGNDVIGIEIRPASVELSIGDSVALTIWVVYENGLRSQLFVPFDSPLVIASSDSGVASVESGNVVRLRSPGIAIASVSFNGLTNQARITVQGSIVEPRLLALKGTSDDQNVITLIGSAGREHVVEISTNLIDWTAIATNVPDINGRFQFSDNSATNSPSRFYRASLVP